MFLKREYCCFPTLFSTPRHTLVGLTQNQMASCSRRQRLCHNARYPLNHRIAHSRTLSQTPLDHEVVKVPSHFWNADSLFILDNGNAQVPFEGTVSLRECMLFLMVEIRDGRPLANAQKYKAWSGDRIDYRKKPRFVKPAPPKDGGNKYPSVSLPNYPYQLPSKLIELGHNLTLSSNKTNSKSHTSRRLTGPTPHQANNPNIAWAIESTAQPPTTTETAHPPPPPPSTSLPPSPSSISATPPSPRPSAART